MNLTIPHDFWDRVARNVADQIVARNVAASQLDRSGLAQAVLQEAQQANRSAVADVNWAR